MEYSFETLYILAIAKLILFFSLAVFFLILFKGNRPRHYAYLAGAAIFVFYFTLAYLLQKMWWGNNGDEVFIFAYLSKVLYSGFGADFYYQGLPNFYPPLYFWLTGFVSKLVTTSGITAAKIGVLFSILTLFIGGYLWPRFFWKKIWPGSQSQVVIRSEWFWALAPIIFFVMIDFDSFILKPFEAVSALFAAFLIGLLACSFELKKWRWPMYLFFGLSGASLFLAFYFWWFMLLPALLLVVFASRSVLANLFRLLAVGIIIALLSAVYWLPLVIAFARHGLENWQAVFFTPNYLFTFFPWEFSLRGVIYLLGLAGLLFFRQSKFMRANLLLLAVCYAYQFFNLAYFISGGKPLQPFKSFLYLAPATLALGAAYLLIYVFGKKLAGLKTAQQKALASLLLIIFLPLLPLGKFIQEPLVLYQLEQDMGASKLYSLSQFIKNEVKGWDKINWLSSGTPDINAYLPLAYYLAHNPHFSHPAALYSKRMDNLKQLLSRAAPDEFAGQARQLNIGGLIVYNDPRLDYYPLFFWADNYPNGGQEIELKLAKDLISSQFWSKIYDSGGFAIYLLK